MFSEDAAEPDPKDRGSATLAASIFGIVAVGVVLALGGRMVQEHRAVEDSLAQTRAYWAAQGHVAYVLSRTRHSGAVTENGTAQPTLVPTAVKYLDEIQDLRTWAYPDISANYNFSMTPTVDRDPQAQGKPGELRVRLGFSAASGSPSEALRSIRAIRPVVVTYCVLGNASANCGDAIAQPLMNQGAVQKVTAVLRPKN